MVKKSAPKVSPNQRKKWLELLQNAAVNPQAGSSKAEQYRFVVDTSVLISAVLYGGRPEQVLQSVLGEHKLIVSDYIVDEFVNTLKVFRPRLSQKWMRLMRQKLELFCHDDAADISEAVRDINDTAILKLAIHQRAVIVTGDRDLLEHRTRSAAAILSVQEYLELFS